MTNFFRDLLLTTHRDHFTCILDELNDLKSDLKTKKRRNNPPVGTYTAYCMIMDVCRPLSKLFRFKRYGQETSIEMFKSALVKLRLLIEEMSLYTRHDLIATFQHIYDRLFILLPQNDFIQHPLFDTARYQSDRKTKPPLAQCFIDWLKQYQLAGFIQRNIERRRAFRPLNIVQRSLKLRFG